MRERETTDSAIGGERERDIGGERQPPEPKKITLIREGFAKI